MSFDDLVNRLETVPFDELRKKYQGYIEIVMQTPNLPKIYPVLENFFGIPFKPAGIAPSREAEDYTKRYGGIQKNQTLYFKKEGLTAHCAMIWPWADGTRATIKIAQGALEEKAR